MKIIHKFLLLIVVCLFAVVLNSCSKKSHPSKTASVTPIEGVSSGETKAPDSAAVVRPRVTKPTASDFPKVITVNDKAAKKSVDGRYYYDVSGHRYWRNNKDGKYYLFNKSMYNNDDFKPQK